ISRNVQQAAQGTAQVATNITDVNRGASETGSASSQVLGSAQSLARESGHLKTEVEKFVNMVRAAESCRRLRVVGKPPRRSAWAQFRTGAKAPPFSAVRIAPAFPIDRTACAESR